MTRWLTRSNKDGVILWAIGGPVVVGNPDCPHFRRWRLVTPWFGIRLHHFVGPDGDRPPHDHPFAFVTLVLWGSYRDVSADGVDRLRAGSVRIRPAEHTHRVETDGAWTLVLSGPMTRPWGFWVDGRFMPHKIYRARYGHAPCD